MKQSILRFDRTLTGWIAATFGQSSRPFFEFMTMLGDPLAVGVITIFVMSYGFFTSDLPLVLSGTVIPITVLIGALLKLGFERARPLTEYAMNMKLKTFSFPSGHSSGSTITYGLLAYLVFTVLTGPWSIVGGVVLAVLPIFVGLSRVYLGAHFPSDVIAGWLLGGSAMFVILFILRPLA